MYDFLDYFESKTTKEAVNYLNENDEAKIISGGTDVLIKAREGKEEFNGIKLVGITRIPELKEIKFDNEENIIIGAASTFSEIENNQIIKEHLKILTVAAGSVGGPQVRNLGTIGGNICNGATSADTASSLFVLDAILIIENKDGVREVDIKDFYISAGKVNLNKDDLLVAFKVKKENYVGYKGHYIKFAQRNAMDIATLGCATMVKTNGNVIEDLKLGFGVAGPTPIRGVVAEEFAKGKELNEDNLKLIGEKALESSKARTSWRGSKEFRENLIVELSARAIKIANEL